MFERRIGERQLLALAKRVWHGPYNRGRGCPPGHFDRPANTKWADLPLLGVNARAVRWDVPNCEWIDLGNGYWAYVEQGARADFPGRLHVHRD